MINEGAQYALKVTAVDEQEPVEALSASGADEAFRDRVGLRRTDRCLDDLDALACEDGVEVAGELAVAVADQEAERRRALRDVQASWRACWVIQAPVGLAVQPAKWTRRLPISMEKSTYSRCSEIVSTVKKSTASMLAACARRNARHEGPERSSAGPSRAWRSSLRTVVAETSIPSPRSSPTMR